MVSIQTPSLILFSQHGMTDTNRDMAALAHQLVPAGGHVVAPNLGYLNTLFDIEPLIRKVEQSADQWLQQHPFTPIRIIATSLGGCIWVEVLHCHPEWWNRVESLVLLGAPIGGADLARIVDPFGWGIGMAKHLGKNRRPLAEKIASVIPTLVVAGNMTGGGDWTVPLEATKVKFASFVCLDGVMHPQLKKHPAVLKTIQEFWKNPKVIQPSKEENLVTTLIEHFRNVPGITDASERHFRKATTQFQFTDGTMLKTWKNPARVLHIFISNSNEICEYSGFVGWVHTSGLKKAIKTAIRMYG